MNKYIKGHIRSIISIVLSFILTSFIFNLSGIQHPNANESLLSVIVFFLIFAVLSLIILYKSYEVVPRDKEEVKK